MRAMEDRSRPSAAQSPTPEGERARVREHKAEGVESNARRVQRERVLAACLAGSSKRVWRTKAAKQQSSRAAA